MYLIIQQKSLFVWNSLSKITGFWCPEDFTLVSLILFIRYRDGDIEIYGNEEVIGGHKIGIIVLLKEFIKRGMYLLFLLDPNNAFIFYVKRFVELLLLLLLYTVENRKTALSMANFISIWRRLDLQQLLILK